MSGASMKRAVALMTASSALVPIVGVLSAPLLARGLGVAGRGELSVATAPGVLLVGVVTFGLPEAVTYFTAKAPSRTAGFLRLALLVTLTASVVGVGLMVLLAPLLTGGSASIAGLVVLGSLISVPLLLLGLVRSAAAGLQMWGAIAIERTGTSLFRLVLVLGLLVTGQLTVLTALVATTAGPLIGVFAYVRVFRVLRQGAAQNDVAEHDAEKAGNRTEEPAGDQADERPDRGWRGLLLRYGLSTWFGSVAGIFLSRINQVMFAPLSDLHQLGLYAVAVTISDVPLITAIAVRDAVFGVSSRLRDVDQFVLANRLTLLVGTGTSAAIAVTLPFWIGLIFGAGFTAAVPATLVLLLSAVVNIPVFIVSAGVAAWGRPDIRSISLTIALVVNIVLFLVLVPGLGAVGAAMSALGSALSAAVFICVQARRLLGVAIADLLVVRPADVRLLVEAGRQFGQTRLGRDPSGARGGRSS